MKRSRPERRYRLLIFDWDGTLLDSIAAIVECTQETLRRLGLPAVAEDSIRAAIGLGIRETVERFVPGCDDELFARIVTAYRHLWLATYCHRPVLIPRARQVLEQLAGQGYFLALATAKNRSGLTRDLEKTGLAEVFIATRTVDEAPSKPHPGMVLDILRELGVRPEEALLVGDTAHDLLMAQEAGVGGLGVCTGSHEREELERLRPTACLESVAELPAWLAARDRDAEEGSGAAPAGA